MVNKVVYYHIYQNLPMSRDREYTPFIISLWSTH